MFLFDLTHTSHTRARTGIQQVCRSMYSAFGDSPGAAAITFDPFQRRWRPLRSWEKTNLSVTQPGTKRGAHWPWPSRLCGRLARWSGVRPPVLPAAQALVVPEVFSAQSAAAFPQLFAQVQGPKLAIFHDAIALKVPELSPPKTIARFPAYLRELLAFDGVAAVSEDSAVSLTEYWNWLGLIKRPSVFAIPLPLLRPPPSRNPTVSISPGRPIVLSVGTLEGRKNHLALLEACEVLWAQGLDFELHLIGFAQAETGAAALGRLQQLQAKGRPLRYSGAVDDRALESAYAEATFTIYPSLLEGFGLPVLESLARGKPCICSSEGALGESARGGGCLTVKPVSAANLAAAIKELLTVPIRLQQLRSELAARRFRTWDDYRRDFLNWMSDLPTAAQTGV